MRKQHIFPVHAVHGDIHLLWSDKSAVSMMLACLQFPPREEIEAAQMQGDAPAAARRPTALPRSISDISETHSLQAYASLRDHGSATDVSLLPLSHRYRGLACNWAICR